MHSCAGQLLAGWRCQDGWPRVECVISASAVPAKVMENHDRVKGVFPTYSHSYLCFTLHLLKRVAVLVCAVGWLDSLPTRGSPAFHSPLPQPFPSPSLHVQPPLRGMNPLLHICFASPSSHRPAPRPAAPPPAGRAFTQHLVRLPSESVEQPTLDSVHPLHRSQHLKAAASQLTSC